MLFNSLEYLVFFPAVTAVYYLTTPSRRWAVLLLASAVFYMAYIPVYLLVLLATVVASYYAGIAIEQGSAKKKKSILIVYIVFALGILFVFKYFNFFNQNLAVLARVLGWNHSLSMLKLILPIGISFYTFQSLAYVIEVYGGKQKAERHAGIYALYIMFFPQLLAGPIGRPGQLLPQLRQLPRFDYEGVTDGLKLIAWGLFKKIVIADRLSLYVEYVFTTPEQFQGVSYLVVMVFFAVQMYCDFSGYSDMAIGSARVLGVRLMDNFNHPYVAKSITEIWRRWHISLSSWIKDYLYTPLSLALRDWGQAGIICTLLISFTLIGLWHGASWNFVVYGFLHGMAISVEMLTRGIKKKMAKALPTWLFDGLAYLYTAAFWCLTLIIFRANTLQDGLYIITHLFSGVPQFFSKALSNVSAFGKGQGILDAIFLNNSKGEFLVAVLAIVFLEAVQFLQRRQPIAPLVRAKPAWLRWCAYYVIVFVILNFGVFMGDKPFIYFQF